MSSAPAELGHGVDAGGGARWGMVAAGAALIGTCYGLARFAYGLFAPELAAEFDLGPAVSGVIGSGSYLGYCAAIVLSLLLTPRWGPRRVAVLAGVVATVGITTVAVAWSAWVLAAGVLVAGSSTGLASPPLAAAVGRWVHEPTRDRAQTAVNAGTGVGVLVSGPVALVALDSWRWAWGAFALVAALVTVAVARAVPAGRADRPAARTPRSTAPRSTATGATVEDAPTGPARSWSVPGSAALVAASFVMGLASIAVWTFGRDLLTSQGGAGPTVSALTWTALGAAGVLGALGGDAVRRVGLGPAWTTLMVVLGGATALLALAPSSRVLSLTAAALFGGSYIALTGLALIWSTRLYPGRTSLGVGISFVAIAAGQAVGAPVVGWLIGRTGPTTAFLLWAGLGLLGALLRPRRETSAPPRRAGET